MAVSATRSAIRRSSGLSRSTSGAATKNANRSRSYFSSPNGRRAGANAMRRKSTGGSGG